MCGWVLSIDRLIQCISIRRDFVEEELSKKELLRLTGISYGQLYRWKREKLIPEEWFHKRASITGQETFFPKTAILNRVARILELKDRYSLEELAEMFSPELSDHLFQEEDLEQFQEITTDVAAKCMDVSEKDVFSFREIVLMCVLSQASIALKLNEAQCDSLIHQLMGKQKEMSVWKYTVAMLRLMEEYLLCVYESDHPPVWDDRLVLVYEADLAEVANQLKVKYHDTFHFHMKGVDS